MSKTMNRRSALGLIGLGAGGALASSVLPTPAHSHTLLDMTDPIDALRAIAKMKGSTDGTVTMGYVVGTRWAMIDNLARPMWNILAGTFSRYTPLSDTEYEVRSIEVAFFTDIETGALKETYDNPVTNKTVDVPQTRMGPSKLSMTIDGLEIPNPVGEARGMFIDHNFQPAVVVGDDVWVTETIQIDGPPMEEGGHKFAYNEMSTYHSSLDLLSDPSKTSVPAMVQYDSSVSFRPWMGFEDLNGHTIARGAGRHIKNVEDYPEPYLELVRVHHPDVLEDIEGILAQAK